MRIVLLVFLVSRIFKHDSCGAIISYSNFIVIKYGFAVMSPTVVPFAPLLVFIDSIITIRMNAVLFCNHLRRPVPRRVVGLEIWEGIIQFVSTTGLLINVFSLNYV